MPELTINVIEGSKQIDAMMHSLDVFDPSRRLSYKFSYSGILTKDD